MKRKILHAAESLFFLLILSLFFAAFPFTAQAQKIVDKTVATVSDNVVRPELITYTDLLWQLALQSDVSINPPSSTDLNSALRTLIDQRLIALEAQRLPTLAPSEAEVEKEIKRVLAQFPSTAEFERRLRLVGFESVQDDNFQRIMKQRVAIEKYLDFRFRSFVVVTPDDENKYYRDVYVPEFRRRNPGALIPALNEVRARINEHLAKRKIEEDIDRFLEEAKRRAEVEILFEV
jgi:parvulin-like peptidyl-prolyl isomerase